MDRALPLRLQPSSRTFTVFHERAYLRALEEAERNGARVDRDAYCEAAELELAALDHDLAAGIAAAVEDRETALRGAQTGVLGMDRVLMSSPFDRPKMSERSAMPLCFASTREQRNVFVRGWYAFVAAFRKASSDFRRGILTADFPPFSFRPSTATG